MKLITVGHGTNTRFAIKAFDGGGSPSSHVYADCITLNYSDALTLMRELNNALIIASVPTVIIKRQPLDPKVKP